MRVLAVTPWFPTRKNPAFSPFMVRDVELIQKNHEVVVLHLGHPNDLSEDEITIPGVKVVRVPFHHTLPQTWLRATRAVRRLSKNADVIHTMAMPALLPTWLARVKKPWIHTEHYSALVEPTISKRQERSLEVLKKLFRFPGEVIAVGPQLAEVIDKCRTKPSHVIGNYVRMTQSPLRPPSESLGADAEIRAIAVGGLIERKGPRPAVEAIAELRSRGYDASLTWVGVGPLEEEIKELALRLGVDEHVHLIGTVPPEQLSEHFEAANLFMLPTGAETFGVALAEALGHGLPVVTSGVGGHLSFLPEKGSRVAERDGKSLSDAVEDLIHDPNRMTDAELLDYARENFSDESRAFGYAKVYDAAISSH